VRSDFKERRDAGLFAVIGFSHAEDVAICATRRVAHDNHPAFQQAVADDPGFTIVLARVLDLQGDTGKYECSVREVEPAFGQRQVALGRIERDSNMVIVSTITGVAWAAWRTRETDIGPVSLAGACAGRSPCTGSLALRFGVYIPLNNPVKLRDTSSFSGCPFTATSWRPRMSRLTPAMNFVFTSVER
jgi:hypothetical protein